VNAPPKMYSTPPFPSLLPLFCFLHLKLCATARRRACESAWDAWNAQAVLLFEALLASSAIQLINTRTHLGRSLFAATSKATPAMVCRRVSGTLDVARVAAHNAGREAVTCTTTPPPIVRVPSMAVRREPRVAWARHLEVDRAPRMAACRHDLGTFQAVVAGIRHTAFARAHLGSLETLYRQRLMAVAGHVVAARRMAFTQWAAKKMRDMQVFTEEQRRLHDSAEAKGRRRVGEWAWRREERLREGSQQAGALTQQAVAGGPCICAPGMRVLMKRRGRQRRSQESVRWRRAAQQSHPNRAETEMVAGHSTWE